LLPGVRQYDVEWTFTHPVIEKNFGSLLSDDKKVDRRKGDGLIRCLKEVFY